MAPSIEINTVLSDLNLIDVYIKSSDNLVDVLNIFDRNKSVPGIIVTKDSKFYKMLSRRRFHEAMSKKYMFELFSKRDVASFFFDEPKDEQYMFLPGSTSVLTAASEALKREEVYRQEPIIVDLGNNFKLLDFYELLLAQTHVHLITLNSLNEANEFKKEILGIAAHDLRNPLNTILGFSKLIPELGNDSEMINTYAGYIHTGAYQMNELLNELLSTAVQDATGLKIKKEIFDLKSLVDSVILSFENSLSAKNQAIIFYTSANQVPVHADKKKVREFLENLISNAIKYSEFDKGIKIFINEFYNKVEIKIQDCGPGFSAKDLEKIFGKFQRLSAKPTGNESSTGLGLYIVKKIVDAHEGKIEIETGLGKGSAFIVTLPNLINEKANIKIQS